MSRGRKSQRRSEAQSTRPPAEQRAADERAAPGDDATSRAERKSLPGRAAAVLGRYDLLILLVLGIAVAIYFGLPDEEDTATAPSVDLPGQTTGPEEPPPQDGGGGAGGADRGSRSASPRETFGHECGTCHTLAAAGTEGITGPDLDEVQPSKEQVLRFIRTGSLDGVMPPNLVRGETADRVAEFVARTAGQGG